MVYTNADWEFARWWYQFDEVTGVQEPIALVGGTYKCSLAPVEGGAVEIIFGSSGQTGTITIAQQSVELDNGDLVSADVMQFRVARASIVNIAAGLKLGDVLRTDGGEIIHYGRIGLEVLPGIGVP